MPPSEGECRGDSRQVSEGAQAERRKLGDRKAKATAASEGDVDIPVVEKGFQKHVRRKKKDCFVSKITKFD
jgi:hypothetical protein